MLPLCFSGLAMGYSQLGTSQMMTPEHLDRQTLQALATLCSLFGCYSLFRMFCFSHTCLCRGVGGTCVLHRCRDQRTSFRSWFLLPSDYWGLNSGLRDWQEILLPAEPFRQFLLYSPGWPGTPRGT